MSARTIAWLMRACTFGIGAGILAMIQPFVFEGFRYGFLLLLVATIGFTIVSHLQPRRQSSVISRQSSVGGQQSSPDA